VPIDLLQLIDRDALPRQKNAVANRLYTENRVSNCYSMHILHVHVGLRY